MLSNVLGGIKLATAKSSKRAFQFEASDLVIEFYINFELNRDKKWTYHELI